MHDQADELRQLVRQGHDAEHACAPRWITVAGGKGGVGATTVALRLAAAMASAGRRVVLVDGDFACPNLASFTAVEARYTICDVLASRRGVHEALEAGPGGIQLLLGPPAERRPVECSPAAQQRLIEQLQRLGAHADAVLVDAGAGVSRLMRSFWQSADDLVLVTTADPVAVMDTYAALKQLYTREPNQQVHALVNQAADLAEGEAVAGRLQEACRRFLAISLASVSSVEEDPAWRCCDRSPGSTELALRSGAATRAFEAWVERWSDQLAGQPHRRMKTLATSTAVEAFSARLAKPFNLGRTVSR